MSDPVLWIHEYASGESSSDFAFPSDAAWIQCVGPGTVVLVENGGRSFTKHAVGGEVYPGAYLSLTSTTCTYVVIGNGPIPPAVAPGVNAATAAVAGSSIMSVAPAVAASPRYSSCLASMLPLSRSGTTRMSARPATSETMPLVRAAATDLAAQRVVSGASTLTMQTARLLEPRPRNLGSKLIEMVRAVQLESRLSKREILALYLTLAPYGGNLEGARAASLSYFGHEPSSLTDGEQAMLIALPQSPEARRPDRRPDAAKAARRGVLDKLIRSGAITEAAADALLAGSQISRFLVLHKELDADDGEMTRTRKVKRGFINDKYQVLVEALYGGRTEQFIETAVKFEDGRSGRVSATLKISDVKTFPAVRQAA